MLLYYQHHSLIHQESVDNFSDVFQHISNTHRNSYTNLIKRKINTNKPTKLFREWLFDFAKIIFSS